MKRCFLWCAGPLTHSLARCLWKAFAYLWGSAENGEKMVSRHSGYLAVAVGMDCQPLTLWLRGGDSAGKDQSPSTVWACSSWASPRSLPSGKSELIQELRLPLHFAACIGHALRSLFLTGWSVNPTHFFSGKRPHWKIVLWVEVKTYKGELFQ